MSENEWEPSRLPRRTLPALALPGRPASPPIAEYLALEFPRESATWLVGSRWR